MMAAAEATPRITAGRTNCDTCAQGSTENSVNWMGGLQPHQIAGRSTAKVAIQNPGTESPRMARGAIASDALATRSRLRTYLRKVALPIEPERRRPVPVVEAGVRRVVLHVRPPRAGRSDGVEVNVVLLVGSVPLDVEDDLPAR